MQRHNTTAGALMCVADVRLLPPPEQRLPVGSKQACFHQSYHNIIEWQAAFVNKFVHNVCLKNR